MYFYVLISKYFNRLQLENVDVFMERLNKQLSAGTMDGYTIDREGVLQELLFLAVHNLFFVFVILSILALLVTLFLPSYSREEQ